jgi:protein-L-isoaspartate(D-aspartate) O-methyltransferase
VLLAQEEPRARKLRASVRQGDGARIPDGPFDAILLSGSVAEVPTRLLELLREGGRLVAITGQEPVMRVTLVQKKGDRFEAFCPWDTNTARLKHFDEPSAFRF